MERKKIEKGWDKQKANSCIGKIALIISGIIF